MAGWGLWQKPKEAGWPDDRLGNFAGGPQPLHTSCDLEHMAPQVFSVHGRQVCRGNVEDGLAAGVPLFRHAVGRSGVGDDNG